MTSIASGTDNSHTAAPLMVPDVSGTSVADAAKHYADAGMYLLPTHRADIKNPGSIVGNKWQDQSTCDLDPVGKWWSDRPEAGIAWDVGRSGAIAFDFDIDGDSKPDNMPQDVWAALQSGLIHSTRQGGGVRAHYVFACEPDEFGNSAGAFTRWGQVRCRHGVIILAPTPHPDADTKGGLYHWRKTGQLPPLPDVLRKMLSAASESVEPKTPDQLRQFFEKHVGYEEPQGLQGLSTKFTGFVKDCGSRHDAMRDVLPWGFREAIIKRFPARDVYDSLKFVFFGVKPEARFTGEFERLACWAAAQAELADPDETRRKVDRDRYGDPLESIKGDLEGFWESSTQLRTLRQFALARLVSPTAMLGATLARVISHIPPNVVLPPTIGSYASLNLYVALVGKSGDSKSTSIRASGDWLAFEPNYPPCKPGSGEGLAKCFAYKSKVHGNSQLQQIGKQWSVLAQLPEVDTLSATGSRGGATIMSALREGWSGERLGQDYAGDDKRIILADNRYRLCLVLGVQPLRAQSLFDESEGGTPQRFVWFPTTDPDTPDVQPPEPPKLDLGRWPDGHAGGVVHPDISRNQALADQADPSGFVVLQIPDVAKTEIKTLQIAIRRGDKDIDPLDGHKLLCQLKVAAALMALESRRHEITETDWQRASVIMKMSETTRRGVVAQLSTKKQAENLYRGRMDAHREIAKVQVIDEEQQLVIAMAERIAAKLKDKDGQSLSDLKKALSAKSTRARFDTAVIHAVKQAMVRREDFTANTGKPGVRLWLSASANKSAEQ